MAKSNPADVLSPTPADEIFRRITAWHQTDNPSPDELIEWLNGTCETLTQSVKVLSALKDRIVDADENTRLRASSTVLNALDFLERAEVAAGILNGVSRGKVCDAFVEGMRLGLLHEKLISLMDGRYRDKWTADAGRRSGANAANADFVELHPIYQQEINELCSGDDPHGYIDACEIVAGRHGTKGRTVRKNTTNPLGNRRVRRKDS